MKTKSIKSPGSLVVRGKNFYAFWRVKDSTGNSKAICKALRDENGAAITTRPEAETAKARLMGIVAKEDQVETLRSIADKIDHTRADIKRLEDEQHPPMTLVQAWPAFASPTSGRKPCEKSTLRAYEGVWTQFQTWIESEHPDVKSLRGVTWEVAKGYLDGLAKRGVSNGTYNIHLSLMRYVFKVLREQAKLVENVWLKFSPLEVTRESRRELTIDELTLVCSKAKGEMKTLFCIGLYTGLRLGDCATLKWGETDLKRGLIRRIPNKIRRKKGAKGLVQISIHPVLRGVLAAIPGSKTDGYVLPETASIYMGNHRSRLANHIQQHFEDCGIETKKKRDHGLYKAVDVGFHSLRHSFISMCAMNNVPLSVVQSLVGHSSPLMTEHYSHSNRLAEQNAIAALPAIGNGNMPTVKPAKRTRDELLREAIESMTPKNFKTKKAAALELLAATV
jgi:integrase